MKLKLDIVRLPDMAIVRCEGRITHGPEATRFQETVERLLAECGSCVLNFDGVTQVDARGLGTLVQLARQARISGHSLGLTNVNRRVRLALQLTGLEDVLDLIRPSEQTAVEHRTAA